MRGEGMLGKRLVAATAVSFVLCGAPVLAHDDHDRGADISMADLPGAVKETFTRESQGGKVEELRKTVGPDGKTIYEGEVVKPDTGVELKVDESGKILHRSNSQK